MTSILESEYIAPKRPYSQNELAYNREKLYKYLRLGPIKARHKSCGHFYFVKKNSRKEKEIVENRARDNSHTGSETGGASHPDPDHDHDHDHTDVGNCSVCWRLHKTQRSLFNSAQDLVDAYQQKFSFDEEPKILTYYNVDIEHVFYKWLYEF